MKRDDRASTAEGQIEELYRRMRAAGVPAPCESPDQFVPGKGSAQSGIAIVGEAPGQQEERAHEPFVGPAGKLLRATLLDRGVNPDHVWITNVVKCRPTRTSDGRKSNRAPTNSEAEVWAPWLMRELEVLRPSVLLCLGNLAASTLIHKDFKMGAEHGRWFDGPYGSRAIATYHPSYVLQQVGLANRELLRTFAEDVGEAARNAG